MHPTTSTRRARKAWWSCWTSTLSVQHAKAFQSHPVNRSPEHEAVGPLHSSNTPRSPNGHVRVLEWWRASGLELRYRKHAVDSASKNGPTAVLNGWWSVNAGGLGVSEWTRWSTGVVEVFGNNHRVPEGQTIPTRWSTGVVEVFGNNHRVPEGIAGTFFRHTLVSVDSSLRIVHNRQGTGRRNETVVRNGLILNWWKQAGVLKGTTWGAGTALLRSWRLEIKSSDNVINDANGNGHVAVLEWWKESGVELKYDWNGCCQAGQAMNDASKNGLVAVLDSWKLSGLEPEYTYFGDGQFLDWWKQSGLQLQYTANAMDLATWYSGSWFGRKDSGLDLIVSSDHLECPAHTADWWTGSGYTVTLVDSKARESAERWECQVILNLFPIQGALVHKYKLAKSLNVGHQSVRVFEVDLISSLVVERLFGIK
ncbi:hypothetical protein BJ742DRAFT_740618 [Cladochytrium replicatum]|nr:hypothetical protein BJ742DRAFT_740618 [Cladochytrium replicatum]